MFDVVLVFNFSLYAYALGGLNTRVHNIPMARR